MTRPLRIEYAGAVYHITSRGNEKKPVFKDDQDRISLIPDVPNSRRCAHRPESERIFKENMLQDRKKRNKMIIEAVHKYGYTQRQIAGYLQMHYSTISNPVRGKA